MRITDRSSAMTLAVFVISFATAEVLMAQPPGGANGRFPGPPPLSFFDKNGDGVLTLEEFRQTPIPAGEHEAVFASIDANSDGVITQSELANHVPPESVRRGSAPSFSYLDMDGDGILTLIEFNSMPIPEREHEAAFSGMDANSDGRITEAEFNGHSSPANEQGRPPPFEYLDLDGNGILTLPEFSSMPIPEGRHDEVFSIIDADGDGIITPDELQTNGRPPDDKPPAPPQSADEQLDPTRVRLLEPERIIRLLDIQPGAKILDLGAGFGLFTFPFAEAAGEHGRVLATDIDETVIAYLNEQIAKRSTRNIDVVRVSIEATDPVYSRFVYDVIFASDVWWDIDEPSTFFHRLRASLQPETGRLWILSWRLDPDFTAIEFSNSDKMIPSISSAIMNRLSEGSRIALAASGDGGRPVINEDLIADLNRLLEDVGLWPEIQEQARKAGKEPISDPEMMKIAAALSQDLDTQGVFQAGVLINDPRTLKLLRGLNRLIILDAFDLDVWKNAFGPSNHALRFWLDWADYLRNGDEPTRLEAVGFDLVQEHRLLPYHRVFEFKRRS